MILIVVIGIHVYLLLSMRNFYNQGIFKTFIKMCMLLVIYSMAIIPSAILIVILAMVSV